MEYEKTELYCTNCQEFTEHLARFSDHERDASMDHFICQVCKWEYDGYSGKYNPPWED